MKVRGNPKLIRKWKLPIDVEEVIDTLDFGSYAGEFVDDAIAQVWLKDGRVFVYDNSHCEIVTSKRDLIGLIRDCTIKEVIEYYESF